MRRIFLVLMVYLLFIGSTLGKTNSDTTNKLRRYFRQLKTTEQSADSFSFVLDSIDVVVHRSKNLIITQNHFVKSGSSLKISYYLEENKRLEVNIVEKSPVLSDLARFTNFNFKGDTIFAINTRWTVRPCLPIPDPRTTDIIACYGYNKNLDQIFLRSYIGILFQEIRQQ